MSDVLPFSLMSRRDLHQWADESKHPAWFIPNLIPVDGVTILYGDGGSGKSRILLEACLYLEAGKAFLDSEHFHGELVDTPVKTAWLSFEDAWAHEAATRLANHPIQLDGPRFITRDSWEREPDIADRLRLSRSRDFIKDGVIDDNTEANWLMLGRELQSEGVQLLVVDATKGLVGGQVGRQEIADAVIELFAQMRRRFGVTTVLIAHSSAHKKDFGKPSDEVMGASTWTHSARHVVLVQSNTSVTFARVAKSNWGPTGFNVQFDRVSDGPLILRSVNSAQEYATEQKRKRTAQDFEKRTEWVHQLREASQSDPNVMTSTRSMATALGISHNTVSKKLLKAGWVVKDGGHYIIDWDKIDHPASAKK